MTDDELLSLINLIFVPRQITTYPITDTVFSSGTYIKLLIVYTLPQEVCKPNYSSSSRPMTDDELLSLMDLIFVPDQELT